MIDAAISKFFDDEAQFKRAMKVLGRYQTEAVGDWKTAETFLMTLDSYDSHLLEKAIDYEALTKPAPSAPVNDDVQKKLTLLTENITPLDSKPLSELIPVYIQELEQGWQPKNIQTNKRDILPKLQLLIDILGDLESKELKPSHIVRYRATLSKLPSNKTKGKFANKSIDEILKMDIPEKRKLSGETVKNYANKVSTFLKWLAKNNYSQPNLNQPLQGIRVATKAPHEQRPPFTPEQLTTLFESEQYTQKWHKCPSHYWVPLLALFTGARQSELCQLYKEDIYRDKDTGIWVIDFNQMDDKKQKKVHCARIFPLHKQLQKMGFLDYIKSFTHDRVFPDIVRRRDGYGQQFSRWFCEIYLNANNCNIKTSGDSVEPVFHSFRHNVSTQLDELGVQAHQISHLVGHLPGGSETTARYIKPAGLLERASMINKLDFPSIDFSKIRHWKRGHKPYRPRK